MGVTRCFRLSGRRTLPRIDRRDGAERNYFPHWKQEVSKCGPAQSGGVELSLRSRRDSRRGCRSGCSRPEVRCTASLNLSAAGVAAGERGLIAVNDRFETNVSHIIAAGDVIGFPALASTSMEQARRAMRHAFGADFVRGAFDLLPAGVYTIPEVSMVGETEESLARAGVEYLVGRAPYFSSARGRIIGDSEGFLKLLFRRDDWKLHGSARDRRTGKLNWFMWDSWRF